VGYVLCAGYYFEPEGCIERGCVWAVGSKMKRIEAAPCKVDDGTNEERASAPSAGRRQNVEMPQPAGPGFRRIWVDVETTETNEQTAVSSGQKKLTRFVEAIYA
jgi:hypothetical protein